MGIPDTATVVKLGENKGLIQVSKSFLVSLMKIPVKQAKLLFGRFTCRSNMCIPLQIAGDGNAEVLDGVDQRDENGIDPETDTRFKMLPQDNQERALSGVDG